MLLPSGRANMRCSVCRLVRSTPGTGLQSPETGKPKSALSRPQRLSENRKMPAICGLFGRNREQPVRIGLRGGGCSRMRTCLSLQIWEKQGEFEEMQGGASCDPAKNAQISRAWMDFSLLEEQGGHPGLSREKVEDFSESSSVTAARLQK